MNSSPLKVSTIIPVYNEYLVIKSLLAHLLRSGDEHSEIIVVDGGSNDGTLGLLKQFYGITVLETTNACRAVQLNLGASQATGDILYFLHADAWPPASYLAHIRSAVARGHPMGCFKMVLTPVQHKLIRINTYFSGIKTSVSGGGDQSLYVSNAAFLIGGGFNKNWVIMEDFEFVKRLEPKFGYYHIDKKILVSARKYEQNSYIRVNIANLAAFTLFKFGASPQFIKTLYKSMLN